MQSVVVLVGAVAGAAVVAFAARASSHASAVVAVAPVPAARWKFCGREQEVGDSSV